MQPREPQWDKPAIGGPAILGCLALVAALAATGGGVWLLRSGRLQGLFDRPSAAAPTPTVEAPATADAPAIEAPTPTPEPSLVTSEELQKSIQEQFERKSREQEARLARDRAQAFSSVAAAPTGIQRVGGDVAPPRVLTRVAPVYTERARLARVQGIVIVEAVVDEHGDVSNVRVLKGLPDGLDTAAVDAVKQWKFAPATLYGKPVAVYFILTVNFKVDSRPRPE